MSVIKYTGAKFPFRFTALGKVGTSTTTPLDAQHIKEGLFQLLLTNRGERWMRPRIGTSIRDFVFDIMNNANISAILRQIEVVVEEQEERVELKTVKFFREEGALDATILFNTIELTKEQEDVITIPVVEQEST